jgi:hypothetical protein
MVVAMVTNFSFFIKKKSFHLRTTNLITLLLEFGSATNPIYDGKYICLHISKLLTATRIYAQEPILLEIKTLLLSLSIIEPTVSKLQVEGPVDCSFSNYCMICLVFGFPLAPQLPITGQNLGYLDQRLVLGK